MESRLAHYFFGLKDEIELNSDDLTLGAIHEIHQNLDSLILRLNNIRNSKSGINKIPLDILYKIFTLAVYDSPIPKKAALNISQACEHWRKLALGSPTLWAFIDLNDSTSLLDLFIRRSENAPLALSWSWRIVRGARTEFEQIPSKYFFSHANSILSRVWSLDVQLPFAKLAQFHHIIRSSGLPLLQLRHLNISRQIKDFTDVQFEEQSQLMNSVNTSHLYQISLAGLDFVWGKLPHNHLTHFRLAYPTNPPSFLQLLTFLSNCPVLLVLDLAFRDGDWTEIMTTSKDPAPMTNGLVLNLTTLRLAANGPSSYDFFQQFSKHIRISKALFQFELSCDRGRSANIAGTIPFSIFEAIPSGISSHLSNMVYLDIHFLENEGYLAICADSAAESANSSHWNCHCSCSFIIRCQGILIDKPVILELMHSMPQINYFVLRGDVWLSSTPHNDMRSLLPSLRSLKVVDWPGAVLASLPTNFKPKELILDLWQGRWQEEELKVMTDLVLERGVELLLLLADPNDPRLSEATSNLREKGVTVVFEDVAFPFI